MNIVFATQEEAKELGEKYTVLELDTFRFQNQPTPVTSYCILDTSSVTLTDLPGLYQFVDLHNNMMKNYRLKNWKYCEDALEHLVGKWRGEMDSFYDIFSQRVQLYKQQDPGSTWDGSIIKNQTINDVNPG